MYFLPCVAKPQLPRPLAWPANPNSVSCLRIEIFTWSTRSAKPLSSVHEAEETSKVRVLL
jgi:hypothetical protein